MPETGTFESERKLLQDLKTGVSFLSRQYQLAVREILDLRKERDGLSFRLKESEAKVRRLEGLLAFRKADGTNGTDGAAGIEGAPAAARMRDELDRLLEEIDGCLTALERGV